MSIRETFSKWGKHYRTITDAVFYLTMALALTSFAVALWAVVAGLNEVQEFAAPVQAPLSTKFLSARITGLKFQLVIGLALAIRVISLWSRKMIGHLIALLALIVAVLIFGVAWTWSHDVLRQLNHELESLNLMSGYPPFFMFGTLPSSVMAYLFVLFLSLACELSIFVVASFRHFSRSNSGKAENDNHGNRRTARIRPKT